MKINKVSLMTGLALGGLLAFSNMAIAQDDKPGGGRRGMSVEARMEKMTEDLKLTDEQKPKVKAVLESTGKKMQELRDVAREERREKMTAIREEENKKLKEILTADQYSKYEKMRAAGPGGEKKKKRDENK